MSARRPSKLIQSTQRARELRSNSTTPEQLLWSALRKRRLAGLKFRRQHPIGPYIADFDCETAQVVVEIDGETHDHRGVADKHRTVFLETRGLRVIRISNNDVLADLENVVIGIGRFAGVDVQKWLEEPRTYKVEECLPSP